MIIETLAILGCIWILWFKINRLEKKYENISKLEDDEVNKLK
jgi:hypothetical protein